MRRPRFPFDSHRDVVPQGVPCALLVLCFTVARAVAGDVSVAAAISLQDALTDPARAYERETGDAVKFTFGSSGQLLAQIKSGAPVDLFVSAAEKQIEQLREAGLEEQGSRRFVAANTLVLIAPAVGGPPINSFADLGDAAVKRLAIGEPQTVPAGQYAAQALARVGLTDTVAQRIVYGANVRQVLDYVRRGEVSAGIVYATDARQAGTDVRVVTAAPPGSHDPIIYPAAVINGAANPAGALRFLAFLTSDAGRRTFVARGFSLPPAAGPATAPTTRPTGSP